LNLPTANSLCKDEVTLREDLLNSQNDCDLLSGERGVTLPVNWKQCAVCKAKHPLKGTQQHTVISVITNYNRDSISPHFGGPSRYKLIMLMPKPEGVWDPKQHRDPPKTLRL
jgi:hypothetical protein